MATNVTIKQMPEVKVANTDVVFNISIDGEKLGELHISKGSVDFFPKGAQSKHFRMSWKKFAETMTERGTERG